MPPWGPHHTLGAACGSTRVGEEAEGRGEAGRSLDCGFRGRSTRAGRAGGVGWFWSSGGPWAQGGPGGLVPPRMIRAGTVALSGSPTHGRWLGFTLWVAGLYLRNVLAGDSPSVSRNHPILWLHPTSGAHKCHQTLAPAALRHKARSEGHPDSPQKSPSAPAGQASRCPRPRAHHLLPILLRDRGQATRGKRPRLFPLHAAHFFYIFLKKLNAIRSSLSLFLSLF